MTNNHTEPMKVGELQYAASIIKDLLPYLGHVRNSGLHQRASDFIAKHNCRMCNGVGMIGGFINADNGYEAEDCPECNGTEPSPAEVSSEGLPELPEPDGYVAMFPTGSKIVPPQEARAHVRSYPFFTSEQMHAYARQALSATKQEEV